METHFAGFLFSKN